jgi:hypothetical protein
VSCEFRTQRLSATVLRPLKSFFDCQVVPSKKKKIGENYK